jgi:predicted transglutaminase-like cysteine proteinase
MASLLDHLAGTGRTLAVVALAALLGGAAEARESGPLPGARPQGGLDLRSLEGPRFFTIQQVMERRAGAPQTRNPGTAPRLAGPLPAGDADLGASAPFRQAGYQLFASVHQGVAAQWAFVQQAWQKERLSIERCGRAGMACSRPASVYADIRKAVDGLAGAIQLQAVNARVNAAIAYQSDIARHGQPDIWNSPLQALGRAGDCEDYAIAKYMLLRDLGWQAKDMAIVLLRDRKVREDHAVLAVRGPTGWRLLDNRWDSIDDDGRVPHYRPVIAVNEIDQRVFAAPYSELDAGEDDLVLPTLELAVAAIDLWDDAPPALRGSLTVTGLASNAAMIEPLPLRGSLN